MIPSKDTSKKDNNVINIIKEPLKIDRKECRNSPTLLHRFTSKYRNKTLSIEYDICSWCGRQK